MVVILKNVGYYNPRATGGEARLTLDTARVDHWVAQGAQTSERVSKLVKEAAEATA
jgi:Ribosomal protein S16